jgi:hypothetical protein
MHTPRNSWIAFLLLASCASRSAAPEAPAHPAAGHSTAVASGAASAAGPAQPHASGKPEIRYYVIGDA